MSDRFWFATRRAYLERMAAALAAAIGEAVDANWLRFDHGLGAWVYPVHRGFRKENGRWIAECIRVHIYDEKRRCWYGSEITETLARFHKVGVARNDAGSSACGDTAQDDHTGETAGEALDPSSGSVAAERWSELLWR